MSNIEDFKIVKGDKPTKDSNGEPIKILKRGIGPAVQLPQEGFDSYDLATNYYQNISDKHNIYVMHPNGIVLTVPYIEIADTSEKGIFITTRYAGLKRPNIDIKVKNELTEKFLNVLIKDDFFNKLSKYNDKTISYYVAGEIKDLRDISDIGRLTGRTEAESALLRELSTIYKAWKHYTDHRFIGVSEFSDVDAVFYKDVGLLFYVGENPTLVFPKEKDYDVIDSGVAITIRNSKNPNKRYYANVLGSVVTIPVKVDGNEDGVKIVKTFKGQEKVFEYSLEDLESLGIYSNYEDAEANLNTETRIKITELETKKAVSDNNYKASELKLELEKLNIEHTSLKHEFERAKMDWESEKLRLERKKKKAEEKVERIQREKEREILELERRANEEKLKHEMLKAELAREKADNEKTISLYKTVATIITTGLTVLGAAWKFFF